MTRIILSGTNPTVWMHGDDFDMLPEIQASAVPVDSSAKAEFEWDRLRIQSDETFMNELTASSVINTVPVCGVEALPVAPSTVLVTPA